MPGPAPRRFWAQLKLERLVQRRDRVLYPPGIDDAGDAHFRGRDHLDVDPVVGEGPEHGGRHARLSTDAAADHGHLSEAILRKHGAGADLLRDALEDTLRLLAIRG